jgi:hypothetical protein
MRLRADLIRGLLFLWSLSLWPPAYFVESNFNEIANYAFEGLPGILFVSALLPSLASLVALALWWSGREGAALFTLFGSASLNPLLFCFSDLEAMMVELWGAAGIRHGMIAAYFTLCMLVFLSLGFGLRRTAAAQRVAVMAALALLGVNVVQLAGDLSHRPAAPKRSHADASGLQAQPSPLQENIYYILLDSYPGAVTTRRVFNYDNPLPDLLAQRGFFSSGDFKTVYFATFLTMSSVLDADYDVTEQSHFPLDKADAYPIHLLGGYAPAAIRALQTIGFKTLFLGNWYARCPDKVFVCLDDWKISQSITFGTFLNATPAGRLFRPAVVKDVSGAVPFDELYDAVTPLRNNIRRFAMAQRKVFVFAHNMAPHPPTQYNPDCSQSAARQTVDLNWPRVQQDSYLAALQCVNSKLLLLLDEIDRRDPGALVVIQSDHGSFTGAHGHVAWDRLSPSLREELTYPINFIRAPVDCREWLYKGIAQVNTMRFMIGCAMRRQPHYLTDDTYIGRGRRDVDGPFILLARRAPDNGG